LLKGPQVYDGVLKDIADVHFAPPEVLKGWKHAEVIKYTLESYSVSYSNGFYVMWTISRPSL